MKLGDTVGLQAAGEDELFNSHIICDKRPKIIMIQYTYMYVSYPYSFLKISLGIAENIYVVC